MASFEVAGGRKLQGTIIPQGAKNEALQVISAVLLTASPVTISNIPDILDVNLLIELLQDIGVKVQRTAKDTYIFEASDINVDYLSSTDFQHKGGKLRGSVMFAGPMLARFKKAFIPKPGGDKIGRRRLDTHIVGLEKLGAQFDYHEEKGYFKLSAPGLKGAYMLLDEPSVTGTANITMAAVLAEGFTTIYNAACEPYLQQLCKMLNRMGAKISGIGSNLLTIQGAGVSHLGMIPDKFKQLGINFSIKGDDIYIPAQDSYEITQFIDGSILTVYDHPWPGFTPDLLSIVLVVATQAIGSVLIHQKMFESRLFFVDKLIDMGAKIILCDPHRATVIGLGRKQPLRGITMSSPDIRAGQALLIAALSAEGKSVIQNIEQIDRGYQNIDERLRSLGADIRRV